MAAAYPQFASFREFYPYYLAEHRHPVCRRLHFFGTSLAIATCLAIVWTRQWAWLPAVLLAGYGPAWIGHFYFERNRPATFRYPFYSLLGDFVMFWQLLTGKLAFRGSAR